MPERLDYIVAIVEEQNITRAARRLFITQPALTKYINKLEGYFWRKKHALRSRSRTCAIGWRR